MKEKDTGSLRSQKILDVLCQEHFFGPEGEHMHL